MAWTKTPGAPLTTLLTKLATLITNLESHRIGETAKRVRSLSLALQHQATQQDKP